MFGMRSYCFKSLGPEEKCDSREMPKAGMCLRAGSCRPEEEPISSQDRLKAFMQNGDGGIPEWIGSAVLLGFFCPIRRSLLLHLCGI